MNYGEEKRLYMKAWREKNREHVRQYMREFKKDERKNGPCPRARKSAMPRPLQTRLNNIKFRCENVKSISYKYYGGRGIKCEITLAELEILWKRDLADKMANPSIDRIDPDKNYTIENCRFVEMKTNLLNRWTVRKSLTADSIKGKK